MVEQGITAEGIVVEDDVWIGAGAVITDNVRIGKGAVVAAGAVVTAGCAAPYGGRRCTGPGTKNDYAGRRSEKRQPAALENLPQSRSIFEKQMGATAREGDGMTTLSIVIPAYNEEGGIQAIMDRVLAVRPALKAVGVDEMELIVVDDGSRDRTAEIVMATPGATLVQHAHNGGYGAALKTGFAAAKRRVDRLPGC